MNVKYSNEPGMVYAGGLVRVTEGKVINCFVTGNVNVDYSNHSGGKEAKVNALFGKPSTTSENCYWYEGLMINVTSRSNSNGKCLATDLGFPSFYIDKIGWNIEDWKIY